jgi:diguanylate cyclase (GGDEF)-like protein/PAS domain S-box-containing protein
MSHGADTRHEAAGGRAPSMLAENLPIGAFCVDTDGRITYVNAMWPAVTGLDAETAVGERFPALLDEMDRARAEEVLESAAEQPGAHRFRAVAPGTERWVEFAVQRVTDGNADDARPTYLGSVHDVTDAVEAVRLAEVLQAVFEATPDLVGITDDRGGVVYMNPAARDRFGLGDTEARHLTTDQVFPDEAFELYYGEIRPQLVRGQSWAGIVPMWDADGNVIDVWQTIVAGVGPAKTIEWLVSIGRDVTEVQQAHAELQYRATHDLLTALPNRTLLLDHLRLALGRRDRSERAVGIVFLDLDGFKDINDRYGHDAGDVVLREVAQRLAGTTRPSDTVARYGGDEFVVLLDGLPEGLTEAAHIARRLVAAVSSTPIRFGRRVTITASAGVVVAPVHLDNPERLITAADRLMYRAKRTGGNAVITPET